jgi:hypothetical protein
MLSVTGSSKAGAYPSEALAGLPLKVGSSLARKH